MILIFGGTTEGRAAVKIAEESGRPYLYSTLGATQEVATPNGRRLTGALAAADTEALCRREGVRLIVDAAHPFARALHRTAAAAAQACGIPVIRFGRRAVKDTEGVIWCDDFADAVRKIEEAGVGRLLALTGVRTIPLLAEYWRRHDDCRFRILDREESVAEAAAYGFPRERLIFYHPHEPETEVLRRAAPDAVLTKESGESGGFPEKLAAARELHVPLYAVRSPALPEWFHTVYTESGLRRRIEELLPGYFPLRSGYTTGTCACAAACAALQMLLGGERPAAVRVVLPGGEEALLPVADTQTGEGWAAADVVKEAGDDPDVTNGCRITVRVARNGLNEVRFLPGEGVGRVTLPGLGLPVGDPAVNPTPRRMIRENFAAAGVLGADVTVSVENGAELALKTFNPRLGIVGGISIIGTSGIVRPFSNEAFVASIVRSIDVARASGCRMLVINSGAKSEAVLRRTFADLPPQAFVHYGNFIGETLQAAARAGFRQVSMGVMLGKAVKLAEGNLDTHSHKVVMNKPFLIRMAECAGCSPDASECIGRITLARELWTVLAPGDSRKFMQHLLATCHAHCAPLLPEGELSMLLISDDGEIAERI